jgi:hypothetical protein
MSAPAVSLETLKDQLVEYARRSSALVAGVAGADAFGAAPEGFRPGDLLPQARSVVVLGGAPPRAGDWISPVVELQETMGTSDRINTLGRKVAHFIEDRLGYYALFVPPGVNRGERPFLSLMLAAELAGCGSRSLAGPILHPTYGMLYYTAIITTAALPADGPPSEAACPAPACRDMWEREGTVPCVKTCPIDDGGCLGGEIAAGGFGARRYDRARCTTRVYNHWIPGFQKALELALDTEDKEKRKMILYGSAFTRTLWSITYSASNQAQCFECMRVCPVGLEYRTKK